MSFGTDSKIGGRLTFAGQIIQRFFQIRGEPLGEKNSKWLNNDYVKFIALAMRYIERSGSGVIGYINSNTWLDRPTFRGVRTSLIDNFPIVRIVDLHGNIGKREIAADGTRDEGVFAIEEGTNITIACKKEADLDIRQIDLLGKTDGVGGGKFDWLSRSDLAQIHGEIHPLPPIFSLVPVKGSSKSGNPVQSEFYGYETLPSIWKVNSAGIVTANDELCIQFSLEEMTKTGHDFIGINLTPLLREREERGGAEKWKLEVEANPVKISLRKKKESRDWRAEYAQNDIKSLENWEDCIVPIEYRPFDRRFTVYTGNSRGFLCMPRPEVMMHLLKFGNLALVSARSNQSASMDHFYCSELIVETKCGERTAQSTTFPLWLVPSAGEPHRRPNIDRAWALGFGKVLEMTYEDGIPRGEQKSFGPDFRRQEAKQLGLLDTQWDGRGDLQTAFGPRDLFDYIYAVLHSPGYRSRYAEFLKSDFPRIPTPGTRNAFSALAALGRQLVGLHLLSPEDAPILKTPEIRFAGSGEARVEKGYPQYKNGKVMINASRWFEDVPEATWEFHVGGYQVCEKWLKDRAGKGGKNPSHGRVLTEVDILHYRRIVTSLTETRRLMEKIDAVIDRHGGWPSAFYVPPPPPPTIEQIIKADEGQELEYKSTLQFDLKEGTKSKLVRKAALKTIVAFLNSGKGSLVIGVSDEKEIVGLEPDFSTMSPEKRTREWFQQTLVNLINEQIGSEFAPLYEVRFATHREKLVAIADVKQRAPKPAYLKDGGAQEFYVRTSNLTKQLKNEEIDRYIGTHWRG